MRTTNDRKAFFGFVFKIEINLATANINMRNFISILLFSLFMQTVVAQTGDEVFTFLRYPTSARANALGGNTVSLVERDPSLIFHNPALLGGEMDGMVNLNYMSV